MSTRYDVGGLQVDRVIEMERPHAAPTTFFPNTPQSVFDENREWLQEIGALDKATGNLVLCFQSHVVRTKHHTILVDACIPYEKKLSSTFPIVVDVSADLRRRLRGKFPQLFPKA